jgi:adenosylhomocysteinase
MRAIGAAELPFIAPGAVLANAGHHDLEIDVPALETAALSTDEVRPGVTMYLLSEARPVYVLSGGALVNIAGGLGHPIEIMDLSFSVQALGCHLLARGGLAPGVHPFPRELDNEIAIAKLESSGIALDRRETGQRDTLEGIIDLSTQGREDD